MDFNSTIIWSWCLTSTRLLLPLKPDKNVSLHMYDFRFLYTHLQMYNETYSVLHLPLPLHGLVHHGPTSHIYEFSLQLLPTLQY